MFLCFVMIVAVLLTNAAAAQELAANDQSESSETIQFCLNGVREHCNSLHSGRATFKGTLNSIMKGEPEFNLSGPVEGLVAYDAQKIRFDISRPGWIADKASVVNEVQPGVAAKMVKGQLAKCFSDDGLKIAIWSSDQPAIAIAQIADLPDRRITEHIDFRCLTLFDRLSIGRGLTLENILEQIESAITKRDSSVVKRGGVWDLIWSYRDGGETTRWILTVDTSRGFVPTRFRCESTHVKMFGDDIVWIPEWENKTDWELIANVWVPTHSEHLLFAGPAVGLDEQLVLDLKWDSINEPLAPQLFTYEGFEVPDDIGIQDTSGGKAIWIKHIPRPPVPDFESLETPKTNWMRSLLMLFGLLAIAITTVYLAMAYRSK